jgi:5-bromo-4-chloroindolyl phosphate hydrolysis protein
MGLFNNLFSKKKAASNGEFDAIITSETGYISEAEKIAKVVSAGLEKENYSGMNQQLSAIARQDDAKEIYVFEHPGVVSRYYAIALLVAVSIAYAYYLFIGAGTLQLASDIELLSIGNFFVYASIAVISINIYLVFKLISAIRFKKRFDTYEELVGYKSWEFIEDIAVCSKRKEALVLRDLRRAIKRKLIPQGHFSQENRVLMVSKKVYDAYMEKPAVYDRYFQQMLEDRHRERSRTRRIAQLMEQGEQYIQKIHGYGTLVKDKNVAKKIARMENLVSKIFHEVDVNPRQANSLGVFLNYYLPTTEKLLDAYVVLDEKQATGKQSAQTKKEIEEAVSTIVTAFEGILEKLYEEYEMDIASDIAALELSMKQDGLPT